MTRFRLLTAMLAFMLAAVPAAQAGDAAEANVLGFSADGAVFAFEEHGVQDGSGFPYANRFYIDTMTDRFLPGTPIRVRIDDDTASVEDARRQARDRAQSILADGVLAANRGFTAGWNAVTELSADPHRMAVNPRPVFPPVDDPVEFRIEEVHVAEPERCRDLGPVMGYRLVRVGLSPDEPARLIHQDSSIPASRGCPLGYRIGGLQTFFPEAGPPVYALLIAIRTFGFEGPDHRWIAVAGRL